MTNSISHVCRRATAAFRIGGGGAATVAFDDAGRCDIDLLTRRKAARAPSKNRSLFVYEYAHRISRDIFTCLRDDDWDDSIVSIDACAARGRVAGSLEDPRPADYERVKATTKTGNWVQLSSSCDIIRLLNPREMAIALNLPANYASDLNCTDSKARTILGSAFGVKSIAHVLACLAGIGEA